jgi:hypothetical protein
MAAPVTLANGLVITTSPHPRMAHHLSMKMTGDLKGVGIPIVEDVDDFPGVLTILADKSIVDGNLWTSVRAHVFGPDDMFAPGCIRTNWRSLTINVKDTDREAWISLFVNP